MSRLKGTTALVTGASGIGAATARRLLSEGAAVGVVGMEAPEVEGLSESLGGEGMVAAAVADLRHSEEAARAFDEIEAALGPVDAVAAVAGGSGRRHGDGPIHDLTADAWRATFEQNATPVYTTAHEAISRMRGRGGSLVIVSSVLAIAPSSPRFETHAYTAAKGAALSLTRALAATYAAEGLRVNAVLPGATATPMAGRAADDPDIQRYLATKQPLAGGMIDPDAVAASIVFLLGPDAQAITGQCLVVDAGWSVSEA